MNLDKLIKTLDSEDLVSAKHIAKNNGQLAIFDLVDKKEIEMPLKSLND